MTPEPFSAHITFLEAENLARCVFRGELTMDALAGAYRVYREQPGFSSELDEMLDFRAASFARMGRVEFEQIRDYLRPRGALHNRRSAWVVADRVAFGLGRMMGSMMELEVPVERDVHESVEAALEWLRPGQSTRLLEAFAMAPVVDYPAD